MKLPVPFIQLPLKFDAEALAAEIGGLDEALWQPHPNGFPGNSALPLVAVDGDPARGNDLCGPMRPTPILEKCPYLRQAIGSLDAVIGRVRLMRLEGGAEVTPHIDIKYYWNERVRVHVPILTNPSVLFFCGDTQVHMGAGECWIFDTWRRHRVINGAGTTRVHLVIDTVGSPAFGEMVRAGRTHTAPTAGWNWRFVAPGDAVHEPVYESVNLMSPMTYWELQGVVSFLLGEAEPHPRLPAVAQAANEFVLSWRALWYGHGSDPAARKEYQHLLVDFLAQMRRLTVGMRLKNQAPLLNAIIGLLAQAVRVDSGGAIDGDGGERGTAQTGGGTVQTPRRKDSPDDRDVFDRPVFIVCPPRSGSSLLFETLALSPSVCTIGGESHGIIEGGRQATGLGAAARGYVSNRLDADDAAPETISSIQERFRKQILDRQGQKRHGRIRLLEKTPKNALRIPFFTKIFPDALFIYLHRDPREVLASMMEVWESDRFCTYPQLPDWTGLPWSLVLVPGWRDLIGKSLPEIVAVQWATTTRILLDDLEALPPRQWCVARYDSLLEDPRREVERLCKCVDIEWDHPLPATLPHSRHTVSAPRQGKWRARARDVEQALALVRATAERAACVACREPIGGDGPRPRDSITLREQTPEIS
ncbi:MAG TPA: sulfotransferase [Rhodanobacteraceae bacterium]|nr:sulfotransferase [Rhodanobacteraceae bacterium]